MRILTLALIAVTLIVAGTREATAHHSFAPFNMEAEKTISGRRGWTKNSLRPGDKVSIVVRPMRDGSPGGMFVRATLADGRELRQSGQAVD